MQLDKRILWLIVSILLMLSVGSTALAQNSTASLRFVHVIPGLTAIDIYVNGSLTYENLEFGNGTTYISVPAGSANVRVTLTGLTTTLWEQPLNAPEGEALTFIAASTNPIAFNEYRDDLSSLDLGTSRFLIVNAIENSPELDIQVAGDNIETQTIISGMVYGDTVGPSQPPAATYLISAARTSGEGEALLTDFPLTMTSGTSNVLVMYGTANSPETVLLTAPVAASSDDAFVRFAHGVAEAPSVDVLVDGTLIAPSLSYGEMTEHIAIPAGSKEISIQVAGSGSDAASATVELEALTASTVIALGTTDELLLTSFADDLSEIAPRTALVNVINTVADSSGVTITLEDGTELASALAANESSGAVSVAPIVSALNVSLEGETSAAVDTDSVSFYGGAYYNLLVLNDAGGLRIELAPTSLVQTINSAPNAAEEMVEAEPTSAPTQEVAATPEPSTVTEPPAATEAPDTAVETEGPTARILLDPGVNLQLREYPFADALSLGLAPSGTIVEVNGREGAPVDVDGNELPLPDGSDWVDPATLLGENEDLVPSDTWLNITYATPDGGAITAWVNALYVAVNNAEGEIQRLADLETIPGNTPGERTNTEITPPPPVDDTVKAIVYNLNAGVQLNIRRTPTTSGEVLERVLNGTEMDLVGIGQSGEWVFVNYDIPEGGSVTGWVSALYVQFVYRGEILDVEELQERNLFVEADEEVEVGEKSADAPPLSQPTVDPFEDVFAATVVLDAGARLNLRRTPDVQAEVLANIPAGDMVVVVSRTEAGDWLEVSFDGVTGWISSQFVTISFNGLARNLEEIPVNTDINTDDTETETENTAG